MWGKIKTFEQYVLHLNVEITFELFSAAVGHRVETTLIFDLYSKRDAYVITVIQRYVTVILVAKMKKFTR